MGQCGDKETCEEEGNGLNYAAPVGGKKCMGLREGAATGLGDRLNKWQILISNLGPQGAAVLETEIKDQKE